MKYSAKFYVIILLSLGFCMSPAMTQGLPKTTHTVWYNQPADEWMKASRVGDGRLGMMIFGGIDKERISINESSMWSDSPSEFSDRPMDKKTCRFKAAFLRWKVRGRK